MHFADALIRAMKKKQSVLCVGLDPQLSKLPQFLVDGAVKEHGKTREAAAEAFLEFNKGIIDAVKDLVPAVKPQLAFYEELGWEGIRAFEETCRYAQAQGLLVIADGKRNDIGSTAEAYARAFFSPDLFDEVKETNVDALTVNAYLGFDGIKPFLKDCGKDKGLFVLVRTSNPSSGDIQGRVTADEKMSIAELMGHFVDSWGSDFVGEEGYSSVGAVVGATYPAEAAKLRKIMPNTLLLMPGYGAQGATAQDAKACFDEKGMGALVVSARGVIYAGTEKDYADAARAAAQKINQELNSVR